MKRGRDIQAAASCGCDQHRSSTGIGRRSFLKRVLGVGALGAVASQGLATKYAFASGAYHGDVLVVVSLRGGMDGINAIVPTFEPRYNTLRPHIGIPQSKLIKLNNQFGMHPSLQPLKKFWDDRTFGVVHAVGMDSPTRSHFAAMAEMERAAPGSSLRSGWLDRVLGLRDSGTSYRGLQMGMNRATTAFNGSNPELAMSAVDDFTLAAVHAGSDRRRWTNALADLNADGPRLMSMPAHMALSALGDATTMQNDGYRPRKGSVYPKGEIGDGLKDIARIIKANIGLQIAAVDYGDWDMHAGMGTVGGGWLHEHLGTLAKALAAFASDLGPTMSRVTVVTLSEFGRRVHENGSGGADHGHGQAIFMLGGGVKGGEVHGTWPGLADADLIDGDLAGTTDYRSILAEALEKRCGQGAISTVFPGLDASRPGVFKPRT